MPHFRLHARHSMLGLPDGPKALEASDSRANIPRSIVRGHCHRRHGRAYAKLTPRNTCDTALGLAIFAVKIGHEAWRSLCDS